MDGYREEHNVRAVSRGGGASLYISDNVEYSLREDLNISNEKVESLFVEIAKDQFNKEKNHHNQSRSLTSVRWFLLVVIWSDRRQPTV